MQFFYSWFLSYFGVKNHYLNYVETVAKQLKLGIIQTQTWLSDIISKNNFTIISNNSEIKWHVIWNNIAGLRMKLKNVLSVENFPDLDPIIPSQLRHE